MTYLPRSRSGFALAAFLLLSTAATSYAAPFAFIANTADSHVKVLDVATNSVVAAIDLGAVARGVAVLPDGSRAYVTLPNANQIAVIDGATHSVQSVISTYPGAWGI